MHTLCIAIRHAVYRDCDRRCIARGEKRCVCDYNVAFVPHSMLNERKQQNDSRHHI